MDTMTDFDEAFDRGEVAWDPNDMLVPVSGIRYPILPTQNALTGVMVEVLG